MSPPCTLIEYIYLRDLSQVLYIFLLFSYKFVLASHIKLLPSALFNIITSQKSKPKT